MLDLIVDISLPPFNAVGDGVTLNTDAFQSAIQRIASNNGGTLSVPSGDFLIGPLNLTSHMVLLLSAGTRLLGVKNISKYPLIAPIPNFGIGRETQNNTDSLPHKHERRLSLLEIPNATNVTIRGAGPTSIIDGQGKYWWDKRIDGQLQYTRPHLIESMWSSNLQLLDIDLVDSPFWTVHWFDSENITVKNVNIYSAMSGAPNTDGWDPNSSRNVLIEDSSYTGGDDCVAVKAGWGCVGEAYGVPSSNITVRNVTCTGNGGSASISIGSEMNGGVRDCVFENLTMVDVRYVANIKRSTPGGGYFDGVRFKDIAARGTVRNAINFVFNTSSGNPLCNASSHDNDVVYKNFSFVNIDGSKASFFHINRTTYNLQYVPMEISYWENVTFPSRGQDDEDNWKCESANITYVAGTVTPEPVACAEIHRIDKRYWNSDEGEYESDESEVVNSPFGHLTPKGLRRNLRRNHPPS